MITIHWVPEMGLWKMCNGKRDIIIVPEDLQPGGRLAACKEAFDKAREAVESGKAICGIHFE